MNMRSMMRIAAAAVLSAVLGLGEERPGDAALLQAIQQSDLGAVKRSIEAGADVNAREKSGASALMEAAVYSTASCMALLLDKGADPNAANQAGATALMWS